MIQWLLDTFIYTGLLIAAVLLLRRPVSRHFGPQVAYALWALPFLRLLMPPIMLPASMAPVEEADAAQPIVVLLSENAANAAASTIAAPRPGVGIELIDLLLPFWLGGAAVFLIWRAREYSRMRRTLLADARPVGEAGKVRLVETPAVSSPVAFGIGDKVVALPPLFMAQHDIVARDMAIAHELAHHRGHDLLANVAAQLLLALHWFNPLAWWGWRAMRKDQEAACDARVVAGREWTERTAYARVIAGFAAGPNLAMAAPMACPVLGEKSIIHRLKSLSRSETPAAHRRIGAAAIATTALALPLTASITYARPDAPGVPDFASVPAPPAPPAPPAAPLPPDPVVIESVDPDWTAHSEHRQLPQRAMHDALGHLHQTERQQFDEERGRALREMEAEMARLGDIDGEIERAMAEAERYMEQVQMQTAMAMAEVPQIEMRCDGVDVVAERDLGNGRKALMICTANAMSHAVSGLRAARAAIANQRSIPERERREILHDLDAEVSRLQAAEISRAATAQPVMRFTFHVRTTAQQPVRAMAIRISSLGGRSLLQLEQDCPEKRGLIA